MGRHQPGRARFRGRWGVRDWFRWRSISSFEDGRGRKAQTL